MKYCPNPNCPFRHETNDVAEYEDHVTHCTDCDAELVEEKPTFRRPADPYWDDMVAIMHVSDPALAPVIESLLEGAGIRHYVHGDNVQEFLGIGRIGAGFNVVAGQPTLFVESGRVDEAMELLRESPDVARSFTG